MHTASVIITPLPRNVSRDDIDCPGDITSYNCSIQSNSETVHLTWRVTLPGGMPLIITYDNTSRRNNIDALNIFISANLGEYERDKYIESTLQLVLQDTISVTLECIIQSLGYDTFTATVNSSG